MGDVVNHPASAQRRSEIQFGLVDALERLGVTDLFHDLPQDQKETLWLQACTCELSKPRMGVEVLKLFFSVMDSAAATQRQKASTA